VRAASRRDLAAVLALTVLAGAVAASEWRSDFQWKPDSLFYRAQVLRIEGAAKDEALRRVFGGPLAAPRREQERSLPPGERKVSSPAWVSYSSRFYERRWVVPLVGASLDPGLGAQGLLAASLIGYVLVAPFLYLLLRLFFPLRAAALAGAACLLLQPLRYWSSLPLTDSFGVAMECLALGAGVLVLTRGRRWVLPWALAVLALSFTRDASVLAVAGAAAAVAWRPTRTSVLVAFTGALASLPAPIALGAPLRESMAYTLNDFYPPRHPTWGFVAHHYLSGAHSLVKNNVEWLGHHPIDAAVLVGGFLCLALLSRSPAGTRRFVYGAAAAAVVLDLLEPNYTAFRLELVFVPFAALGLAAAAERAWRVVSAR
jgi:hypothetical protein